MTKDYELYCSYFNKYDLHIDQLIYSKLKSYSDILIDYNKNVNLTAITDPKAIIYKHFIDSMLISKYAKIPENASLIDVGTGAGFPSIPLKIYRPDIKITLLDSLNKRIEFLKYLCNELEIEAELIHGRAEDISKMPDHREKFDVSCARAVANLSTLSEYCLPFVKVGGQFISMKGPNEDIEAAKNAINILGGELVCDKKYELENEVRRVITISKISQTPSKYPRNSAQIKKNPL